MAKTKEDGPAPERRPEAALVQKAAEAPERRAPTEWAEAKGTKPWALAGAFQRFQWPGGFVLTEREFDDAISEVMNLQFSAPSVLVRKPAKKITKRGKRWLSRA